MILTEDIIIRITDNNMNYYEHLGYDVSLGEDLHIPICLLSKGSHYKILCKCDKCGVEKKVIYKNYIKYDNKWGEYFCRKCSEFKRKESLNKTHGVDYPIQNKLVRDKVIVLNSKK